MNQDPLQVLLVEDKLGEARLFCARLEEVRPDEFGVKVEHASRLLEATGRLATGHYDAILLDLSLPDSHGVETVQRIHEGAADTPIIVLTGTDDGRIAAESLSLGAQDYLVKDAADASSLRRALRYAIERKRAERALRKAHDDLELRVRDRTAELAARTQLLSSILSNVPHRVFWKNKDSVYLGCNENFAKDVGLDNPEEIVGKTDYDLPWAREQADAYREAEVRIMETGRPMLNVEEPDCHVKGMETWRITSRVALRDNSGEIVGILGLFVDITDRKRVEKELLEARDTARAATKAKSEFLATMSHELRTPLSGMLGTVGLLMQSELNEEQRRFASLAQASGNALLALINDILDFSKIDAGKLELEEIEFDLHAAVDGVAGILACNAHEKNLELVCDIQPDVPPRVWGDPKRLTQVLINLVGNAVKFTENGEVVIRVTCEDEGGKAKAVRFAVTDTGIGIPQSRLHRLFQTFFQVDASTTRRYGGTGLGLAISERLVTAMQGRIGVTSNPGVGSTFWFTIPFEKFAKPPEGSPHGTIKDPARFKTLVVDDNATCRPVLRDHLTRAGVEVCEAPDGRTALRELRVAAEKGVPFGVVVVDARMPSMSGPELCRAIKAGPKLRDARVILMMHLNASLQGEKSAEMHFDACMTKPVRQAQLIETIAKSSTGPDGDRNASPPLADEARPIPKVSWRKLARILLAEDYEVNQLVLKQVLVRSGYECDVVSNGKAAVQAAQDKNYDLILMDCQMPEIDGYEATRLIRGAAGRRIPIIALTASALMNDRERCLEAGMDDYVTKPITPAQLLEIVSKHLDRSEPPKTSETAREAPPRESSPAHGSVLRSEVTDECIRDCLPEFLADLPLQVNRLRQAVAACDFPTLGDTLHRLKGAAGVYGFMQVTKLAADLEESVEAKAAIKSPTTQVHNLITLIRCIENYDRRRERNIVAVAHHDGELGIHRSID